VAGWLSCTKAITPPFPFRFPGAEEIQDALEQGVLTETDLNPDLASIPEQDLAPHWPLGMSHQSVPAHEMHAVPCSTDSELPTLNAVAADAVGVAPGMLESLTGGRTATTSTEDFLAGMLFDAISKGEGADLSPQTVLPALSRVPPAPVGASATKPPRPERAGRCPGDNDKAEPGIDLKALMLDDNAEPCNHTGLKLSPGVLAGLEPVEGAAFGEVIDWDHLARELFM